MANPILITCAAGRVGRRADRFDSDMRTKS